MNAETMAALVKAGHLIRVHPELVGPKGYPWRRRVVWIRSGGGRPGAPNRAQRRADRARGRHGREDRLEPNPQANLSARAGVIRRRQPGKGGSR